MKNYYKVFGLRITATDADIKQAYRRLAKTLHPDLNMGNPDAEKQLAEVNEAYEVLSDPVKRAEYNKTINSFIMRPQSTESVKTRPNPQGYGKTGPGPQNFAQRFEQMAAQAQAAQAAQAAQVHAQFQAQYDAGVKKAYSDGYTKGYSDSSSKAESEIMPLKNEIASLRQTLIEKDKELEYADKDYQSLSDKYTDLLAEHTMLEQETGDNNEKSAPSPDVKASLERFKEENERIKKKLNANIETSVQKDIELEKLRQEVAALKAQIANYEEYVHAKSRDEEIENIVAERITRIKSNKKEFKNTFYGVLGLNYWATQEEIKNNYDKLSKRFKAKADAGDNAAKEKLKLINEAVMTLYDEVQRAEYNRSLKIADEDIERERKLEEDYRRIIENYALTKEEEDFNAYLDDLMMLAQSGDSEAQNSLGLLYYDGEQIDQDFEQAVFWFKESAKQQHAEALYNLGLCYYYGEGVGKDVAKGEGFIKQASKKGFKDAAEFLKK